MEKKAYKKPFAEILEFDYKDQIVTSGGGGGKTFDCGTLLYHWNNASRWNGCSAAREIVAD